jgi:biopolymer transport protein ExbD
MVFASGSGQSSMVDMNITPLVDVMLVLLVIFMVTVPAVSYSNSLNLPHPSPNELKELNTDVVRLHLSAGGIVEWNGTAISMDSLERKLGEAASVGIASDGRIDPMRQPRVSIDADPAADYQQLTQVLARTSNAHLQRVGFADAGR